jgi:hypothetical protein
MTAIAVAAPTAAGSSIALLMSADGNVSRLAFD